MDIKGVISRAGNLPASEIVDTVNVQLAEHDTVVITAPPGAGKSTLLPITIMHGMSGMGKILMLEPRRIAARQIAERMADILEEKVGGTVGYRIRFENCVSQHTRIEVITEGILTRMAIDDPTLDGVDAVIFDEFHERSINSDLAFALVRKIQSIVRPDLKVVIMSATIDTAAICQVTNAPLIESKGKMFPVEVTHSEEDISSYDTPQAVAAAVASAHNSTEGDILAFLPGQGEIMRCMEILGDALAPTTVYPLYGNMATNLQRAAIAPSRDGERKIVLATPIAETSITIEGVRTVIDSGLCRANRYDPNTGLSRLETTRISKDMATQRTGRAGRVAPGKCFRLWSAVSEHSMEEQRTPEIVSMDLTKTVLDIAAFGEKDILALPWLTPPPTSNAVKAKVLLQALGALDDDGNITELGRKMASMPCHPRIAKMIINAGSDAQRSLACDIAAILEERDPLADSADKDLALRVSTLRSCRSRHQLDRWKRIAQIAKDYCTTAHVKEDDSDVAPHDVGKLVAAAYPERIAKALDSAGGFRLANGDEVRIEQSDKLSSYKWIAIASMHSGQNKGGQVFLAAPTDPEDLDSDTICERDNIVWDNKAGCVVMQREQRIGKLVVSAKPLNNADGDMVKAIVCEAVRKYGLSMLAWSNEKVISLQKRVATVAQWHPELDIPDLSADHLMQTADEWLYPYLERDGHVMKTAAELKKIDLQEVLWAIVPYDVQQQIDLLAPTHIQVPTGSRIRIDYRLESDAPVLSVRLQECFGMKQTPCVDNGRRPLLMELLSPGFKPVQLTKDIVSFWNGAYFEVRKELRRRYPKHYWPENPLESEAVRGTKRTKK